MSRGATLRPLVTSEYRFIPWVSVKHCGAHGFIFGHEVIPSMPVLWKRDRRAPFAVLAASSRAGVDYRAGVDDIAAPSDAYFVGCVSEHVGRIGFVQLQSIVHSCRIAVESLFFNRSSMMKIMLVKQRYE